MDGPAGDGRWESAPTTGTARRRRGVRGRGAGAAVILLLGIAALGLAGCGDDDSGGDDATTDSITMLCQGATEMDQAIGQAEDLEPGSATADDLVRVNAVIQNSIQSLSLTVTGAGASGEQLGELVQTTEAALADSLEAGGVAESVEILQTELEPVDASLESFIGENCGPETTTG